MKRIFRTAILCALAALSAAVVHAQTTEFTYQGRLTDSAQTASGNYDLEFKLFDAETGGAEIGTLQRLDVTVTNGIFSVKLDFGANFNGQPRFLEIAVRASATQGAFTILSPRQPFTSVPYSIKSLTAETAVNAEQLGGAAANQYVVTDDPRMTDERNPAPNSPNYIQNATAQQANSNFNISGNGSIGGTLTARSVNALTQLNINGQRAFSLVGSSTFAGLNAGTLGNGNTFFGASAGQFNTAGEDNSFFGHLAGQANTTGIRNSFFGKQAGTLNSTGIQNSVFGEGAGTFNQTGSNNTLMGVVAGRQSTGSDNSFFGFQSGTSLRFGDRNTAVGTQADFSSPLNANVSSSTLLGAGARLTSGVDISFATAIGAGSLVTTSNTVVLGRSNDTVRIPGALNVFGSTALGGTLSANRIDSLTDYLIGGETVLRTLGNASLFVGFGAGTANTNVGTGNVFVGNSAGASNTNGASNSFFGNQAGSSNTTGPFNTFAGFRAGFGNTIGLSNSFFGANAGAANAEGSENTFLGMNAGRANTSGNFNVFSGFAAGLGNLTGTKNAFFGRAAGVTNTSGSNNTVVGSDADVGAANLDFATAIGAGAVVNASNTIQLGRAGDTVNVSGFVTLQTLGLGGNQVLCRNGSLQIGICSSSLRYKTNIAPFNSGLNLVGRLRPITFDWKTDGARDLGLAAEEVAAVEPLLVVRNEKGEVEGVKYDRIGVVLLNAVKEQQAQIEAQQKLIEKQQAAIDGLKKLVCGQNPNAEVCMEEQK